MPPVRTRIALLAVLTALAAPARAQTLELHVSSNQLYAGLPFVLTIQASGFEETPEPKPSELSIPGAKVQYLGATPNVTSMIQIINGVRSERREVTWALRFRIEPAAAGPLQVPAITVEQAGKSARSQPARASVIEVATTTDMRIRAVLPARAVWAGESFDAAIEWYLRRDAGDQSFSVPLLDHEQWLQVAPGEATSRQRLAFPAGSKDLELPFAQDRATLDGVDYTRLRFPLRVTALQAGTLTLPPARVVAALKVGQTRDSFGFPQDQTQLFRAEDQARTLEIKPLPQAGRPDSFANAVGTAFAIEVAADRTVVQVGDPIELRVRVRGKGRMEGLLLPDLAKDGGLPPAQFTLAADVPPPEPEADGARLFKVQVRLKSTAAREIPALPFSYFDPELGQYRTVRSQPIALQVRGANVVGPGDVVSASAPPGASGAPRPGGGAPILSMTGADLTLSQDSATLRRALTPADVRRFVYGLYGAPLLALAFALWRRRTAEGRHASSRASRAVSAARGEIARAAGGAARDAAPRVVRALQHAAAQHGVPPREFAALVERLETEAFDPAAADRPLAAELRSEAERLVGEWAERPRGRAAAGKTALLMALAALGISAVARAADDSGARLGAARAAYRAALAESDRDRRTAGFLRSEAELRALAAALPGRPELYADWGAAALGAQDLGHAVLAFRRALAAETTHARARKNLAWARHQLPDWVPHPRGKGTVESLLFWHGLLTVPARQLGAAVAFALAILLLAPFARRPERRRLLRGLAIAPALVWLGLLASLALEHAPARDAVVIEDGPVLRAADSPGAPPVLPLPLPAGTEVALAESQGSWSRVSLPDGTRGWLPSSALERVTAARAP